MTIKNYFLIKPMIDEDSIRGLARLYREITGRCYKLAKKYSRLTMSERHELDSLHKLADEIVTIWKITPDDILITTRA